jgi:hypothetical protein
MKDLYKDSIVRFKKTGNLYKILSSTCKMKHPETREWIPAVVYQSYKILEPSGEYKDDPNQNIWTREFQDFNEKFELILKLWN